MIAAVQLEPLLQRRRGDVRGNDARAGGKGTTARQVLLRRVFGSGRGAKKGHNVNECSHFFEG